MKKILKSLLPQKIKLGCTFLYLFYFKNILKKYYKKIGEYTELYPPIMSIPQYVELDEYTRLQSGTRIISSGGIVTVKKYSAIAASCTFLPGTHVPTVGLPQFLSTTHINDRQTGILIEEDVWVGTNCTFLPKSCVRRGAVVGACSLVNKEVPPYSVVAGSPAKLIAVRFSLEQILEHERILYPPEERMKREDLELLFSTIYKDLKTIGTSEISDEDLLKLDAARKKVGMKTYENL